MEGRACFFLLKRYFPHGQYINYLFSLSGRLPEMLKLAWPYFFLFLNFQNKKKRIDRICIPNYIHATLLVVTLECSAYRKQGGVTFQST